MNKIELKKFIEKNKIENKEAEAVIDLVASNRLRELWNKEKELTGITQKEKAAQMGFSQAYFANFIGGKRTISLKSLIRFAEAFGCNCSDIVQEIKDK
tara:strand:- start:83 stop:376 length:294 start_codon:yes stop_codon:yes gene_type:complete